MLMQMPGPRDIVIYLPGPRAFSVVQKPWGWAHILVQKPRGARGGMVTGQIDTCITTITTCQTAANKQRQCLQLYSSRLYVTDCVHSGTLEYFLDERIEKCFINIFWLLSQAVKLRQHGIDCFL